MCGYCGFRNLRTCRSNCMLFHLSKLKSFSKGPLGLRFIIFFILKHVFVFLLVTSGIKLSFADYNLQSIVTEINHAIGAQGIVSAECKQVVTQYGDSIWDLLVTGVGCFYVLYLKLFLFLLSLYPVLLLNILFCHDLQVLPDKVCSQLSLCLYDGAQYVRSGVTSP